MGNLVTVEVFAPQGLCSVEAVISTVLRGGGGGLYIEDSGLLGCYPESTST